MDATVFSSNHGIWPAWLVMFILSLLLGWIPFIGPAIAGFVGGMMAGGGGTALLAAIIPSLLVAAFILLLGSVLTLPVIGALVGIGVFMVLLLGTVPLLIGAWIGGAMAQGRRSTRSA